MRYAPTPSDKEMNLLWFNTSKLLYFCCLKYKDKAMQLSKIWYYSHLKRCTLSSRSIFFKNSFHFTNLKFNLSIS